MWNLLDRLRTLCLVAIPLVAMSPVVATAAAVTLYLDPHGSDKANGGRPDQALRSLQKALNIAYFRVKQGADQVRIEIAPGRYVGQQVRIGRPPADAHFEIVARPSASSRPIFDGGGRRGTWFIMKAADQNEARFTFSGLEVANYLTAMSFEGNRELVNTSQGNNVVQNMVFRNIGQAKSGEQPSTAAVRFVNSRHNVIRGNHFINIRNKRSCGLLHSIYLAHHSSDNRIENNTFKNTCGSPIRLRDASNNNIATRNVFREAEFRAVFDEWYCNPERIDKCTKKIPECPSWGNRYEANTVSDSDQRAIREPTVVHIPEIPSTCDVQAGAASSPAASGASTATYRATNAKRERIIRK
ncbi:right-handed parallel beta-helix repeat-containing protein [Bordetella petrii]|uniref:right-handed parallel beta-helix repeat-containing protein n=1 Tax=Bordetella petrii TaxID=94624 RepID=UPI0018CC3AD2|nr:right-handed parallel beta-helix repeat-containing protein [Bordetella petrii]